jgi:hypothetical protein
LEICNRIFVGFGSKAKNRMNRTELIKPLIKIQGNGALNQKLRIDPGTMKENIDRR